jgi:two-component system LytT family response regulator
MKSEAVTVMTMRALIVDDEPLARRGLQVRLKGVPDVEVIGECGNGRDAVAAIAAEKPDLVFLDIQMPVMDGFAVLREIQGPEMPLVVFVTAFDEYAIRAFEAHAMDYLLKPVDDARLADALERAREQKDEREAIEHRSRLLGLVAELGGVENVSLEELLEKGLAALDAGYLDTLPIKDGSNTIRLRTADIDWIDAAGDYMCVHAEGQTHIMRGTMKKLEDILDPRVFQRVHRSTIVNVNRVRQVRSHINGEYFLILDGDVELKMSRHYKDKIAHFVPAV